MKKVKDLHISPVNNVWDRDRNNLLFPVSKHGKWQGAFLTKQISEKRHHGMGQYGTRHTEAAGKFIENHEPDSLIKLFRLVDRKNILTKIYENILYVNIFKAHAHECDSGIPLILLQLLVCL